MFAAIEKYRLPAQILLGAVAISFVGFGLSQFDINPNNRYIVKIGDQIITRHELDNAMRGANGASRETVLRQLMNRAYLHEGAKQLGISISDTQIKQAIVDNPQFHDANGKFSESQFQSLLENNGMTQEQLMGLMRDDLLVAAVASVLSSSTVSDAQATQLLRAMMATRSLRNVGLNPQAFENKVQTDDASIKKFYDANHKSYTLPQAVQFEFVRFSPKSLAEKETLSDEEWQTALAESKNSPNVKRSIAHILIPFGSDKAKSEAQAKQIASELQAAPNQFAAFAQKYSQDEDSKNQGGVIGEFSAANNLVSAAFKEAAFAVKSGEVSNVVESEFGFHIIKATQVGDAATDEAALRQAAKEKKAQNSYNKLREQMAEEAFADSGSLKKGADKLGLTVQSHDEWLTRDNAPAAKIPKEVVDALFGDEVFVKKHNSDAIVVDGEVWFVRVKQTREQTLETFDKVKEKAKQDWLRSESSRLAMVEAKRMVADLQAGKNITLDWSPVQEVAPEQMRGNLSPEAYRAVMAAAPKNGKPAYVLIDNLGAPQILEIQKIQDIGKQTEAIQMAKTMLIPAGKSEAWQEAYLDYLSKHIKTEQGSEKVSNDE